MEAKERNTERVYRLRHHVLLRPVVSGILVVSVFCIFLRAALRDQDLPLPYRSQQSSHHRFSSSSSSDQADAPDATLPLHSKPHQFDWSETSRIVVFGDSISATMFDPHAEQPSSLNPFGNPDYPTKRPNGPTWADFLTLTHNQSQILTYNFAKGGATIDNAVQRSVWSSPSCSDQILQFLSIYGSKVATGEWDTDTTLLIFRFGVNDCMNEYTFPDHVLDVSKDILRYEQVAEILHAAGLRNFLFLNIGPIDENFRNTGGDPARVEILSSNIAKWNAALPAMTSNLTARHSDIHARTFDTHSFFSWLEKNPAEVPATKQLQNTTGICPFYSAVVPGAPGEKEYQLDFPGCSAPLEQYFWVS
ncbi:MAG: hypothetical protein Q9162_001980 [Coniocarpon cinnabarinum]